MKPTTRRLIIFVVILLSLALLMAACQREREPEEASTDWDVSPIVTPAAVPEGEQPTAGPAATTVSVGTGEAQQPAATTTPVPATPVPAVESPPIIDVGPTFDYLVKPNDTLFSIAQVYEVDIETLRRLNNLADDNIQVGQILKVPGTGEITQPGAEPGTTPAATEAPQEVIYVVEQGDTLSSIGAEFGVEWQDIAVANGIEGPNYNIYRGQRLVLPGVEPTPVPTAEVTIHVVASGDSMYSIAVQYGVTLQALMQANQITNPDLIIVGQELIIPD